jgi:hypothetical protein
MNFSQFMQKFTKNAKDIFERNDKLFFCKCRQRYNLEHVS